MNETDFCTKEILSPEEKWEKATIANNFIFYKVMRHNPDVCRQLLEILLEMKIDRIVMKQEEEIQIDYDKKGIRMDVYARSEDKAFNLEIQATDTGEIPERARYYQGILDVDELNKGAGYKDLSTSYIIFICLPDIFKKGLCKYTFENICRENTDIKLNDRTYKYFFIARNYDKILNEEQKALLKFFTSNESSNAFSERLAAMVKDAKLNTQWRKQFMYYEYEIAHSFRTGKDEGKNEKAVEDAVEFLKENIPPETIAKCVKLPLEKVLELKEQITVKAWLFSYLFIHKHLQKDYFYSIM